MISKNAQMPLSILYNVNAITLSICPQNAEGNATITLMLCTTLLKINNNAQMPLSILYNANAMTKYTARVLSAIQQYA